MASIEDRWVAVGPAGRRRRTVRWGRGLRWRVRWERPDGGRASKSFATREAADEHLAALAASEGGG